MRIAIIHFPINKVGGIDSWAINIQIGFRRLGHEVQLIHSTPQSRFKCHPTEGRTVSEKTIIPGIHLGYRDEDMDDTLEKLNGYDLVMFLHAAPHPTKANLNYYDIENWKRLYKEVSKPKMSVFHDRNWTKTNEWITEVVDHVDGVLAAQHHFLDCAQDYASHRSTDLPPIKVWWEYQPFDIPELDLDYVMKNKDFYGVVATQWIAWKNHKKFLPMLPEIEIPIRFYGAGMDYNYIVKDGDFDEYMGTDHKNEIVYNEHIIHSYYGFVPYQEVLDALQWATFSIDLSTRGYVNMTHMEPLMYGAASLMSQEVFNDPYCGLPAEALWIYNFEDLPKVIEEVGLSPAVCKQKARNGREWMMSNCDCTTIAANILKGMELC